MTSHLVVQLRKQVGREHPALLLDVDFQAPPGFTILFGPSGAGKTSLLNCIAGLITPDAGRIAIDERVLFDADARLNLPPEKRRVGYVFQDLALFPHLSVIANVEYGLSAWPRRERRARALSILEAFRVGSLAKRNIRDVSGGERQRVALARTLVTDPAVLLLDEPLTALDASTKSKIIADLRAWNEAHGIPILYVTHNRDEVFALGERVIVIEAGGITVQGLPHEVLDAPRQESIAQLAGFENIFDATVELVNVDRGTMTCKLKTNAEQGSDSVQLETPLLRAEAGTSLRVGIRAGDILLAIAPPVGLSARNVIAGKIVALERRDVMITARVNCGVEMEVHLTLAAQEALDLMPGKQVWLVIKTHSCHLLQS